MNFFFDHNLSPHLAAAIGALSKQEGHHVEHLTGRFDAKTPDVDWITKLGEEGGWTVITQDRFKKSAAEREAFRGARLTTFYLARQWSQHPRWDVAWHLVRWWPKIVAASEAVEAGAVYEVPWQFGRLRQARL